MYADRGLVKHGKVSNLFNYLYSTFIFSFSFWAYLMLFIGYFDGNDIPEVIDHVWLDMD